MKVVTAGASTIGDERAYFLISLASVSSTFEHLLYLDWNRYRHQYHLQDLHGFSPHYRPPCLPSSFYPSKTFDPGVVAWSPVAPTFSSWFAFSLPVVDTDTPFGKQLIWMAGKVDAAGQGMGELEDELGQAKEQLEAVKADRGHWKEKREEIQRAIH